jgi:hypothetical protein
MTAIISVLCLPEKCLVDPYWLWARATEYVSLGGAPHQIPVLLELHQTPSQAVSPQATGTLPDGLRLQNRYLASATGLEATRYCTGYATMAVLEDLFAGGHSGLVRRFEIGLPIVPISTADDGDKMHHISLGTSGHHPPVLAVIDDGLPIAHPRLLGPAGQSTCLALWDQDARPASGVLTPPGLDYGRFFSAERIGTALGHPGRTPGAPVDDARVYESFGLTRLRRSWTHGSAVLGLAALGAGHTATQAPSFIGVQLPRRTSDDTSGLSLAVHVLDALHFVLDQADAAAARAGQSPGAVVANLSFGRFAGAHDGSGMLCSAIDALLEGRNNAGLPFAVVLPAGNGQLMRGRARSEIPSCETRALTWRIQPDDRTPSFVELWPTRKDPLTVSGLSVSLRSPAGVDCGPVGSDQQAVMCDGAGRPIATVIHLSRSAAGDGAMILVAVSPTFTFEPARIPTAPAGSWTITLHNCGAQQVDVDAWIQRDDRFAGAALGGRQSRFEDRDYARFDPLGRPQDEDPKCVTASVRRSETLNPIATGRYPVVVGARTHAPVHASRYSAASVGKPPQVNAVADLSAAHPGIRTLGTRGGPLVRASGTSLAAPQVARWLLNQAPAPHPGVSACWARTALVTASNQLATLPLPRERGGAAALPWPWP